jgi:hypothetical protein
MDSHCTPQFWKHFDRLPAAVQNSARDAYRIWQADPYDSRLEFKQVIEHPVVYSVRSGYRYRALCRSMGDTVVWFWIGTHEEYNNRI